MDNRIIVSLFLGINLFSSALTFAETTPGAKFGLSDYSVKGYMTFVTKDISSSAPILICLPGSTIQAKQDINNWAFTAGKRGFIVVGLDVDYTSILSFSDVEQVYSRMSSIIKSLAKEYRLKNNKLYLAGTSAGGMVSIALALHYPGKFAAVGVVSGGTLGFGAQEELRKAKGSHFYMVHGDKDERVPLKEFQSTVKLLEQNGAIIDYNIVPGGRHTLNSNVYNEVVSWIADLDNLLKG